MSCVVYTKNTHTSRRKQIVGSSFVVISLGLAIVALLVTRKDLHWYAQRYTKIRRYIIPGLRICGWSTKGMRQILVLVLLMATVRVLFSDNNMASSSSSSLSLSSTTVFACEHNFDYSQHRETAVLKQ